MVFIFTLWCFGRFWLYIVADDSDSSVIQIDKGDYHVTFEFYGNEEVKTIDEIEEVEVIEGEDGDENPYNHYERTRHLFDAPEKSKKEFSQRKKYVFLIRWGASSRWFSSLYCSMRNSDQMTIPKAHPTL